MDFIRTYGKEIVSLLIPFITWWLNVGVKGKAKLIWSSPHAFVHLIQEPLRNAQGEVMQTVQKLSTASVRVINIGRESATKVELVFNWKPNQLSLWPPRHFTDRVDADNRYMMIFDSLSPKEQIGIEIVSLNADLPAIVLLRCDQCVAPQVPMMWVRQFAHWKSNLFRFLILLGGATSVYLTLALIQFLVLQTPPR